MLQHKLITAALLTGLLGFAACGDTTITVYGCDNYTIETQEDCESLNGTWNEAEAAGWQCSGERMDEDSCATYGGTWIEISLIIQCTPQCDGMSCGGDGCGGSCGACSDGATCDAGTCMTPAASTGNLIVTNDIDWSDTPADFVSASVTGGDYSWTSDDAGIAGGFSVSDVPAGDYAVTVTDAFDVAYVMDPVPITADADNELSVIIAYATAGALELTNNIDFGDGDAYYVVGLYATPPGGGLDETVMTEEYNWLEGVQLSPGDAALAIGIPGGSYSMIIADDVANLYVLVDILITNGEVATAEVTVDNYDEDLTRALDE